MNPYEEALLSQLTSDPSNATRRVYADWLEESGQARESEFLRLQSQSAEVEARLRELTAVLDPKWLALVGDVRRLRDLELPSGRTLRLRSLRQSAFYAGLLEGVPTAERNAATIAARVQAESRHGGLAYLVPPVETPISMDAPYPFGTPARVPAIECVARLHSHQPVREHDYSELTVIWFQEQYAFPIEPAVLAHLRGLDWDQHATDYEF